MYSPFSDLFKMFHTPDFIIFRVLINDKIYLGRPNTMSVDNLFTGGKNQKAEFFTYSSIEAFIQGEVLDKLIVTAPEINGLEAIDIINPEPLNKILSICLEFDNISEKSDIGIIKRSIPETLEQLLIAIENYEKLHNSDKYEIAYDFIDEVINDCKNASYTLSELDKKKLIINSKEKVSVKISNLIEFS